MTTVLEMYSAQIWKVCMHFFLHQLELKKKERVKSIACFFLCFENPNQLVLFCVSPQDDHIS